MKRETRGEFGRNPLLRLSRKMCQSLGDLVKLTRILNRIRRKERKRGPVTEKLVR